MNYYPQLTGRLHIDPENGTRTIDRLETGATLLEATCKAQLSCFRDARSGELSIASLPGSGVALLAPWNPAAGAVQQDPLLTIQHTRFACGAVAIGVRLARVMSDAGGFIQLYRDLAEIYRSIEKKGTCIGTLKQPPHILPFMAEEVAKICLGGGEKGTSCVPPSGYSVEPALSETPMSQSSSTEAATPLASTSSIPSIIGRELRFSSSELSALKRKAQAPDGASWVSTFSALSAHIWQRSQIARGAPNISHTRDPTRSQPPTFFTSVDFSSKMDLGPKHFPAAVVTPCLQLPESELINAPLWRVAKAIHDMTHSISPTYVRHLSEWIISQPRKQLIRQRIPFGSNSLITTAWTRCSLYEGTNLDTSPVIAGVPFTPTNLVDGLSFFLRPKEDNEDIIVLLALAETVWEKLDQDKEFRHVGE